jgi:hypothetical protein
MPVNINRLHLLLASIRYPLSAHADSDKKKNYHQQVRMWIAILGDADNNCTYAHTLYI